MVKFLPKALLVLAVTAFSLGASARTQENAVWSAQTTGDMSALRYGAFDADLPLMLLSCFNALEVAVLDIYDDVGAAKPGEPVTIELVAGDSAAPLEGEAAEAEETAEIYAEASDFPLKPVIDVLRKDGPLTVKIDDTSRTFSDFGKADAVESFAQACALD